MNGVIKKKVEGKDFGFISAEGQEKDFFFHKDSLVGVTWEELNEGEKVTFDTKESPKGPNATNVQRAGAQAAAAAA